MEVVCPQGLLLCMVGRRLKIRIATATFVKL